MKKIVFVISLTAALATALVVRGASPTDFSGNWLLDKNSSQGLNDRQRKAESITMKIKQDEKQITIERKFEDYDFPTEASTYSFDGQRSTYVNGESSIFTTEWLDNGKMLQLQRVATAKVGPDYVTLVTLEKLTLSNDGKVLKYVFAIEERPQFHREASGRVDASCRRRCRTNRWTPDLRSGSRLRP